MTDRPRACPNCGRHLAVAGQRCPGCGAAPAVADAAASPVRTAVPSRRNQRWHLGGTYSLVVGIAFLVSIVGVRVLDEDSTPWPASGGAVLASVTTGPSPVPAGASPIPAIPTIAGDLPSLPSPAAQASPDPAAAIAPGEASSPGPIEHHTPLPVLTPYSDATPALEPLRPDRVPAAAEPATVVEIVEGDVIRVRIGDGDETIRLLGIDTPESTDRDGPVECFGAETLARTAETIPVGTQVWLEADVTDVDQSGRLWRYVWFVREANGRAYMLNERLLAEGYAEISAAPPDVKYLERFERAQTLAQDEGRGLWPACGGAELPPPTVIP